LQQFRTARARLPLHPREKLLLWVLGAHLVFLPWALGGMKLWAQLISVTLAAIGLIIAILPRAYSSDFTDRTPFRLYPWSKLLRFPLFWAGLLLLLYVGTQALNPAWAYTRDHRGWWMEPLRHVAWLPHGTENPFRLGGPWRALIVYGGAWMLACSIWIGITRRRALQILFTVLAANGFALAIFAIVQRLVGNGLLFWFWPSPNASFFGSFIYKNHAGAYLLLVLIVSLALAAWHHLRSVRRMEKSNPAGVFLFFGAVVALDILISYARGATIGMLLFLGAALALYLTFHWRGPSRLHRPVISIVLLIGFAAFLSLSLSALSSDRAWKNMGRLFSAHDVSVRSRHLANLASWDMLKASWPSGNGAGSYQFLFPRYQQHYPEIFQQGKTRLFWDHAHNDLLELPIELGAFGVGVVVFAGGYWLYRLGRFVVWRNPFGLLLTMGLLLALAHACTDFLFACPAILVTWCALWPCVVLWTEFEERNPSSQTPTASP
jgi:hypothetical protein